MEERKKCFACKEVKLKHEFQESLGFTRPVHLGRCLSCRDCNIGRAKKNGGFMKKIEGKFNYIEATEDEIIDHHNKGLTNEI